MFNSVNELPSSIKNVLPETGQKMFIEVANASIKNDRSESVALQTAWGVVKKRFKTVNGKWVANSEDFVAPKLYVFELEPTNKELVFNDEDGEISFEAVLATTTENNEGRYFGEEELSDLAEQINSDGSTLPDFKHEIWQQIAKEYTDSEMSEEQLQRMFQERKGVFKTIKAAVKGGKLWVKGLLDKRYKNHIKNFDKVSIEAIGTNVNNRITKPRYLGFTFTNKPKLRDVALFVD